MNVFILDAIDDLCFLSFVSVLKKGLDNSATIMLKQELIKLEANQINAFLNKCYFFTLLHFLFSLLDQEFVVINL